MGKKRKEEREGEEETTFQMKNREVTRQLLQICKIKLMKFDEWNFFFDLMI